METPNTWNLPLRLLDLLVEEGLTSPADAERIRAKSQQAWVPLGKFLRQRGHLTMNQLMHLLKLQTSEPSLRLGELAVREGLCTEAQVEEALRLQREANPHPLDLLLSELRCDAETLNKVLIRYIRESVVRTSDLPVEA